LDRSKGFTSIDRGICNSKPFALMRKKSYDEVATQIDKASAELTSIKLPESQQYLSSVMIYRRHREWEIGPRGHALRALAPYNERVLGDTSGERRALLAR
jgi:hypothetical protein